LIRKNDLDPKDSANRNALSGTAKDASNVFTIHCSPFTII